MANIIRGLDHFYAIPDHLGDFHTFIQTLNKNATVVVLGHSVLPSENLGALIFIEIQEDKNTYFWQLVSLMPSGHRVLKTYLKDTLPVNGNSISRVELRDLLTEVRLDFVFENETNVVVTVPL